MENVDPEEVFAHAGRKFVGVATEDVSGAVILAI
jgi:hypothetical protein